MGGWKKFGVAGPRVKGGGGAPEKTRWGPWGFLGRGGLKGTPERGGPLPRPREKGEEKRVGGKMGGGRVGKPRLEERAGGRGDPREGERWAKRGPKKEGGFFFFFLF